LTDLPHPLWRGRMMGWLHRTRLWYLLSVAYVVVAWRLPSPSPLGACGLSLRAIAALSSSANVLISDGYHNGDLRGGDAYTAAAELTWLRWDYVGISAVLTSLLWLWSSNLAWMGHLRAVSIAGGVATALVALLSAAVVPRKSGHTAVKLIMATQFVGFLGYLVSLSVRFAPFSTIIYWVYAPGLILYVLKQPKNLFFGFHELFHTSVLAGHLTSMFCDFREIASPMTRLASSSLVAALSAFGA